MHELTVNLHMHTSYSDGTGTHADLGAAALRSGLDVILVTDHNVLVKGLDGYYQEGKQRLLLLTNEEIHDQGRLPQKSHLLVLGAEEELATLAGDPQALVSAARQVGALSFLAHPFETDMPVVGETAITWEDWNVTGFTGIEIWNGFSELKSVARSRLKTVFYAFVPEAIPHGPPPETLRAWDDLMKKGQRLVAIGGSDAHSLRIPLGLFHKTVFPYAYHFSTINTHLLTPHPLTGRLSEDRKMIFESLGAGHCFVGNDLPAPTRGFRFSAQGREADAIMGDEIAAAGSVTLQIKLPSIAKIRLLRNGECIVETRGEGLVYPTRQPGVYRVEAYKSYLGKLRGWIFSNPIYLK